MLSYENRNRNGVAPPTPPNEENISNSRLNTTMTSAPTTTNFNQRNPSHAHIWLITGPAGCGKSTVAKFIAESLELPYLEGDEFHPPANIEKMSNNIPLQDSDRWDWLTILRQEAVATLTSSRGVVVTCSALKRKYRDVIRVAPYYSQNVSLHFIYLHATEEVLLQRVAKRENHYMGADMVHSQFEALEEPEEVEKDIITVDVSQSLQEVKSEALKKIKAVLNKDN